MKRGVSLQSRGECRVALSVSRMYTVRIPLRLELHPAKNSGMLRNELRDRIYAEAIRAA